MTPKNPKNIIEVENIEVNQKIKEDIKVGIVNTNLNIVDDIILHHQGPGQEGPDQHRDRILSSQMMIDLIQKNTIE